MCYDTEVPCWSRGSCCLNLTTCARVHGPEPHHADLMYSLSLTRVCCSSLSVNLVRQSKVKSVRGRGRRPEGREPGMAEGGGAASDHGPGPAAAQSHNNEEQRRRGRSWSVGSRWAVVFVIGAVVAAAAVGVGVGLHNNRRRESSVKKVGHCHAFS